jgi:hypothetical protein
MAISTTSSRRFVETIPEREGLANKLELYKNGATAKKSLPKTQVGSVSNHRI